MYDQYLNQSFPRKQVEKIGEIYLYSIEKGDNLYEISRSFNTKMEMVAALNNLNVNDILYPGQQLFIPVLTSHHHTAHATKPMMHSTENMMPYQVPATHHDSSMRMASSPYENYF